MEEQLANPEDVPRAGGVTIEHDLACVSCGYNLRTLSAAARCPECGSRVSKSLSGGVLEDDPAWLVKVRGGAVLLAWFTGLLLAGFALACMWQALGALASGIGHFGTLEYAGNVIVVYGLLILFCVGAYLVTAPATRKANRSSLFRVIARYGGLPLPVGLSAVMTAKPHGLEPAIICGLAALLAGMFAALAGYARFLAKVGGDGKLQRFAGIVLWASIAVLVPPVWGAVWFFLNAPADLSTVAFSGFLSQLGVIGLALEPVLLFVVFVLLSVLMNGVRKMLDRSIEAQTGA